MFTIYKLQISYWFVVFLGLCAIHTNPVWGQLNCLNYTSQDGLPADMITCAVEDHDGFMWFGSSNGICKFDGFSFDNYSYLDTELSPGGNFITTIEIDNNNELWVGTSKQGIFHHDQSRDTWEHFATHKTGYHQLNGNEIFFINSDRDGKIWYGSDKGGLGCINPKSQTHDNFDLTTLPRRNTWWNRTYDMVQDRYDQNLIYLVGQGYLYKFNKSTKEFTTPAAILESKGILTPKFSPRSIVQKSSNEFILGSKEAGVRLFNTDTGQYQKIFPEKANNSFTWMANVFEGGENEFWITVRQEGIAKLSLDSEEIDFFRSEPFNRNGLLKGEYISTYNSSRGQTWVLTSKGVSLILPQHQHFEYFETEIKGTNFFLDIDRIPDSDKFFASYGGENAPLKILDRNMNVLSSFHLIKPYDKFQVISKSTLFKERILCLTDKLYELDLKKETLSLKVIDGLPEDIPIQEFLVTEKNELWLLLNNGSLAKYDEAKKEIEFHPFLGSKNTPNHKVIYHSLAKVGDQIWAASHEELIILNTSDGQFNYLYFEENKLKQRSGDEKIQSYGGSVKQILPIDQNCAWVITSESGIYKICKSSSDSFELKEHRNQKDLRQLQTPIKMIDGESDDYWIATKNGLVHADRNLKEFRVYNQTQGLKKSNLEKGFNRIGDQLYIGMHKGYSRVNTKDLLQKKKDSKVHIIMASVGNILIDQKETKQFNHKQNNFLVTVASPNYSEASQVKLAHRLINHSNEWRLSGANEKTFRYDKLLPGIYTFEVKTKAPNTNWSPVESISFVITSPIWKRNWFRLLMALSMMSLLYLFYHSNLKRKLEKEKIKTDMAELEGQALRAQMNPHFIFNSLNSIKSLMLLDRKKEGVTYLTKFSRMVREILSLSKEKEIPLQRELELLGIYLDMEGLRFQGKFECQIDVSSEVNTYQIMVPPLLIQPFAENSIWHGLLHKEGDSKLLVKIWQDADNLFITIKDNGIGRKASAQIKSKKLLYGKTSEGIKLSMNRLKLLSKSAKIEIQDLYDKEKSTGTLVTIKIPSHNESKN